MSERRRRSDFAVALFVTIFWAAVVFAVDGIIAIVLDRDPIEADVGPYYAIVALLLAVDRDLVVGRDGAGERFAVADGIHRRPRWSTSCWSATAAPIGLGLVAEQAASPFVIAASLLSGLTVVFSWSVLRRWWPNQPH